MHYTRKDVHYQHFAPALKGEVTLCKGVDVVERLELLQLSRLQKWLGGEIKITQIQSFLLKVVNEHQNDWDEYLDLVPFTIQTSKHKSTDHTPLETMYKR